MLEKLILQQQLKIIVFFFVDRYKVQQYCDLFKAISIKNKLIHVV